MSGQIYLIESPDRRVLAETFMRFQEYYESPVFRGKTFSREEFAAWYAMEYGSFSYAQDWSGFNIPSWVLEPFKRGDFGVLTEREQKLLDLFKEVKGNFYIIGATPEDEWWADTVRHEFVHGAFHVNQNYRNHVNHFIKTKNPATVKKTLCKMGYGSNVLDDETNAYLLTEPQTLARDISLGNGANLRDGLDEIFRKYFGFSMVNVPLDTLNSQVRNFLL